MEASHPYDCVIQKEQRGTGDAVKPAMEKLKDFEGKVLVLLGDEPFLDLGLLEEMVGHDGPSVMAIEPESNKGLGRMVTDKNQNLLRIVEEKDCNDERTRNHFIECG